MGTEIEIESTKAHRAKYLSLAQNVINGIEKGSLAGGQKLMSVRAFARQQDVSINTAINCYRYLETHGFIRAQPRSGYYVTARVNRPFTALPQFETQVVSLEERKQRAALHQSYFHPFYTAQLSADFQADKIVSRALATTCRHYLPQLLSYSSVTGDPELCQVLADYYSALNFPLAANELLVQHGCLDGVRLALEATTKTGDVVAISSPCFSGLLDLLASMERRVLEIPSNKDGLDCEQLVNLMADGKINACLLSSNHQNPSGMTLSVKQKKQLAEAANRFKLPIIEDDVYQELYFSSVMPLPIKAWDKHGYVIWVTSVAKTLAAGLKLGWCAPGRFYGAMAAIKKGRAQAVSPILQHTFKLLLQRGEYQQHLRRTRRRLFILKEKYRQMLIQNLPSNAQISKPEGGMVLWIHVPNLDGNKLQKALQQREIFIRPGDDFSSRNKYRDCFRINFSWGLEDQVETDLLTLCELVKTHSVSK